MMVRFLASVRSPHEALAALQNGADIIDLKEPASGALGRLDPPKIAACLAAVAGQREVSATIGDMPLDPEKVVTAVDAMAATGVDIVKLGIFEGEADATLDRLSPLARAGVRLVAVFFADRAPDFRLLGRCAEAGFLGVMLDTAAKGSGSLTTHLRLSRLEDFISTGRRHGLLTGLAGSLREGDIDALLPLKPDYLGFRSALTRGSRADALDPGLVRRIANKLATATAGAQSAAVGAAPV